METLKTQNKIDQTQLRLRDSILNVYGNRMKTMIMRIQTEHTILNRINSFITDRNEILK